MTTLSIEQELAGYTDPRLARPRCRKWMRNAREHCARLPGHSTECRTQYAQDNALAAKRLAYVPARRA